MGNKIDSSLSSQTYALTFETLSATNPEHCIVQIAIWHHIGRKCFNISVYLLLLNKNDIVINFYDIHIY